mmetsp:Transcript_25925/g.61207  ORF Transcript_25925/g.61207 Transcript_25925/m.61207 type:complete len:278 (+) Transcript_25925:292-1125(+)
MKIADDNGDLGNGDNCHHEHKEEEAKKIVESVLPHGREDEGHLDKYNTEWKDASEQHRRRSLEVPGQLRYLSRYGVGTDRHGHGVLLEAKVGSEEDEGQGHAEPEETDDNHGAEGHGRRGIVGPEEEVEDEEHSENNPGEQRRRHHARAELIRVLEELAEASRSVPGGGAHDDIEEDDGAEQRTAVGRGEETQHRASEGKETHDEHLLASADEDGEQARVSRGTEDISVNQLPPCLLPNGLRVAFVLCQLVVHGKVLPKDAHHDDSDGSGEEKNDNE